MKILTPTTAGGALAVLGLIFLWPLTLKAGSTDNQQEGRLLVSGEASASAPADVVTLQIAVVTEHKSSQQAVDENSRRSNAALEAIRSELGEEAEIETLGFSLNPQYGRNTSSGDPPVLRGYRARNVVQVRTSQLEKIGGAIDAAAGAGSNEIQSLQFGIRDPLPLRMQALADATRNAREKAAAIASALDVEVAGVVSVEEGNVGIHRPMMQRQSLMMEKATPIEAGEVDVTARVTLTLALAD
ncbi:MAG: SIMPL domain-containing protein [Myxococcota bacterium]|nr:SIMPL domain-containing protein [Myxococcota bacterium]